VTSPRLSATPSIGSWQITTHTHEKKNEKEEKKEEKKRAPMNPFKHVYFSAMKGPALSSVHHVNG
jgi:hypothetical protein